METEWLRCSKCGSLTDPDEIRCSAGCDVSILESIEYTPSALQVMQERGKVYTKRPFQFWPHNKSPPQ